jgi:hypothetical protein
MRDTINRDLHAAMKSTITAADAVLQAHAPQCRCGACEAARVTLGTLRMAVCFVEAEIAPVRRAI